jgi:hypothetical protein
LASSNRWLHANQKDKGKNADAGTIRIEFIPNSNLVNGDEIAFVQTIRRVYTGTSSAAHYSHGMEDRKTKKGTAERSYVLSRDLHDHDTLGAQLREDGPVLDPDHQSGAGRPP